MPYIKHEDRFQYDVDLGSLVIPGSAGELNYVLSRIVLLYLGDNPNYQKFCEVEGVLSHMSKEIYRRLTAPYEDEKIANNGDVVGFDSNA